MAARNNEILKSFILWLHIKEVSELKSRLCLYWKDATGSDADKPPHYPKEHPRSRMASENLEET